MNIRRFLNLAAAFAAVAAAAAVVVVAASFTVYALAKPYLGEAGASAVVAGVFALIAAIVAWLATRKAAPKPRKHDEQGVADRLMDLAKERPMAALGVASAAAVAATFVLIRNPAVITAMVSAFMAGKATKSGK